MKKLVLIIGFFLFLLVFKVDSQELNKSRKSKEIVIQPGPKDGKDTTIQKVFHTNREDECYGHPNNFMANLYEEENHLKTTMLIKIPFPEFLLEKQIVSAKLGLWGVIAAKNLRDSAKVNLSTLSKEWDEDVNCIKKETKVLFREIYFLNPKINLKLVNSVLVIDPEALCWHEFDITSLVKGWARGEENYGFEISLGETGSWAHLWTSNSDEKNHRPKLTIEY